MSFKVYTSPDLFNSYFLLEPRAEVESFRLEEKGMGAASIRLLYKENTDPKSVEGTKPSYGVNSWVFIVDTKKTNNGDNTINTENTHDPDKPKSVLSPNIVWWGYIANLYTNYQYEFKDWNGSMDCYQYGHWLNNVGIKYRKGGIKNGFNPIIDGVTVGNKIADQNAMAQSNLSFDPSESLAKYWKVKDVVDYMTTYASSYSMDVDWSKVNLERHPFLNNYETIESYEARSLQEALNDIIDPLTWDFIFTSDSAVTLRILETRSEGYVLALPDDLADFQITTEELSYDRVELIGDRVLWSVSVSPYSPSGQPLTIEVPGISGTETKVIGKTWLGPIVPNWNDQDLKTYVNGPITGASYTERDGDGNLLVLNSIDDWAEYLESAKSAADVPDLSEAAKTAAEEYGQNVEQWLDEAIGRWDSIRKADRRTYQSFRWNYDGDCIYNYEFPGHINKGRRVPLLPEVIIMNGIPPSPVNNIISPTKLNEAIPDIPYISENSHKTPPQTELQFEDFIPANNWTTSLTGEIQNDYVKNKFFFKSAKSFPVDYNGEVHMRPSWLDGTLSKFDSQSGEMTVDMVGPRIEFPYPEAMGSDHPDLFSDPVSTSSWDPILDNGVKRDEWSNEPVGPSRFDPVRRPTSSTGHWARTIFSFSMYSDQRLEMWLGNPNGKKIKRIYDEDFKLWILRRGLVLNTTDKYYPYLTDNSSYFLMPPYITAVPEYLIYNAPVIDTSTNKIYDTKERLGGNKIARNDIPLMKKELKSMYDYYSMEKRAVRMSMRAYDETGEIRSLQLVTGLETNLFFSNQKIIAIGDSVSYMKMGNREITTNSYISSIEYYMADTAPRLIISTQIPSSPERTRKRQVIIRGGDKK